VLGTIAIGILATKGVNPAGADGLLYGNPAPLGVQVLAVLVVSAYALGAIWLILKLIDLTLGLRVREDEERLGLDATQHGQLAYQH
jgi:ammonium transporter, Amt family